MIVSSGYRRAALAGLLLIGLSTAARAGLTHRYSFTDKGTVKDSAGNVDGKLVGDATVDGGKLTLKNDGKTSDDDATARVEFAQSLLPKAGSVSLVFWFTASEVTAYARVLDFGEKDGASGTAFIYFTPRTADDMSRAAITATDAKSKTAVDEDRTDDGKAHMIAIVIDGDAKKLHLYIDGKEPKPAEDLGDNTLDKVHRATNWLGRSEFDGDPGFSGSIDEFRVYDQALTAADATAAATAGPATVAPVAPPLPATQPAGTQAAATTQPGK